MARIRTIKPEFFKHEELYIAEKEEKLPLRIAFAGLWCASDREGRFKWRPNQLKLDVLPYDTCDFSRVLDALATRGFIEEYSSEDGQNYGFIPSFTQHQVINNRESQSLIPSPFDACSTRDPRGLCMLKGKGKERKGKELASTPKFIPPIPDSLLSDFLAVRKAKKAGPLTETAFNGLAKEARKAGLTVEQAIEYCCKRSWVGFEAAWIEKDLPRPEEVPDWKRKML